MPPSRSLLERPAAAAYRSGVDSDEHSIRNILDRLRAPVGNPVARARWLVERQVPEARRGPGWDRHWRELEAYLDSPVSWSGNREAAEFEGFDDDF